MKTIYEAPRVPRQWDRYVIPSAVVAGVVVPPPSEAQVDIQRDIEPAAAVAGRAIFGAFENDAAKPY